MKQRTCKCPAEGKGTAVFCSEANPLYGRRGLGPLSSLLEYLQQGVAEERYGAFLH